MRCVAVGLSVKENKPDQITTFLTSVLVGVKSHEGGHVIGLARVLFTDAFLRDETVDELAWSHVEPWVPDLLNHMLTTCFLSFYHILLGTCHSMNQLTRHVTAASVQAPQEQRVWSLQSIRACTLRTLQTLL